LDTPQGFSKDLPLPNIAVNPHQQESEAPAVHQPFKTLGFLLLQET